MRPPLKWTRIFDTRYFVERIGPTTGRYQIEETGIHPRAINMNIVRGPWRMAGEYLTTNVQIVECLVSEIDRVTLALLGYRVEPTGMPSPEYVQEVGRLHG